MKHIIDFMSALLGSTRQRANFIRDYGKTTPLFSSSSGFDRGVERKQIGLLGDASYHLNNRTYLGGFLCQLSDNQRSLFHIIDQIIDTLTGNNDYLTSLLRL